MNSNRQARTESEVRAEILEHLDRAGPLNRKQILRLVMIGEDRADAALAHLEAAGKAEQYRKRSKRGRMDTLWCLAGRAPSRQNVDFRGQATLDAMQALARTRFVAEGGPSATIITLLVA